ncbi:MAG: DUF2207 domain-containing protein [Gammaproteobacteria bacterium]
MQRSLIKHVSGLLACLLTSLPLAAQERILAYDSEVEIRADGSLDVTEHITVRAEGSQIRRGIYRDLPTRYRDRYGNRVVVDFEMLGVQRNGRTEPWFTEEISNGVRINTGNDEFLPVPAEYTFTLHYRTTRQIGFFAEHDELYWNAIGTGWVFPIESGSVEARLPEPVPVGSMQAEGYSGAQGAKEQDFVATLPAAGVARWELTRPLMPQQGLTIVLSFPKGVVAEPDELQRMAWLLQDNRGALIALAGLIVLLLYCVLRWRKVGRDPRKSAIIARYEPPEDHSPAGLRFMQRMGYDTRCFSSDLLALAVGGQVRIHRDDRLFKDDWRLEKVMEGGETPTAPQAQLLSKLFGGSRMELELDDGNAATISAAHSAHRKALTRRFQPEYFRLHGGSVAFTYLIGIVTGVLAFNVGGGSGLIVIIPVLILMVGAILIFTALVKAPTRAGRKLLDEIEGLTLYLGVAERDELASMQGPGGPPVLDAERYEKLLPYAVALEVEDAWTKKFTRAVGEAAAAAAGAGIAWYHGGRVGDLGSLSKAVGSSLSSQIASSSSPPGSSSGSGGGGSSGGGGGGGGGGGR